tara:strand:- start:2 stop:364 length:363 start_codon:yes stop_codon:yes gene_type:complete
MKFASIFIICIILSIYIITKKRKSLINKKFLIERFKQKFKNRNTRRQRITEEFNNSLLLDPESNITIGSWYSEHELREKADIHRSRLSKFGKSKINGEMLFVGPKGGIYKLTDDGKKKYV